MLDLDKIEAKQLSSFANNIVASWQVRDSLLSDIWNLRTQNWTVEVPEAFRITSKTQHSSLPVDIATRVPGTLTQRDPTWHRLPPSELERDVERCNAVKRYFAARHQWDKSYALPAKSAYLFLVDQVANKGAGCVGILYAPQAWANAPTLHDEAGKLKPDYWRDSGGKATESEKQMDLEASSKAYEEIVDVYRRRAIPPIEHRYLPTEQCYPVYAGREMIAMVIRRKVNPLELSACGLDTARFEGEGRFGIDKSYELTEVWTKNRARYFLDDGEELFYRSYKGKAMDHGYGWVPFIYQTGLEGGTLEWGSYGMPLLSLVKSNIELIDHLQTFRYCAIHMASFTSWWVKRKGEISPAQVAAGAEPKTYHITPGTIHDFRDPNVEIEPFTHPGLNKDFDRALADERAEVRRIIPDVLMGIAESSGYNSAIMTQQAKSIFNPILDGVELLLEQAAVMEMWHIEQRVPGPVYLAYAYKDHELLSRPTRMELVRLRKEDIAGYYHIEVATDREIDRITLGQHAAQMEAQGHFNREWVHEMAGGTDFQASERKRRVEQFRRLEPVQAYLTQKAIEEIGIEEEQENALAAQQIQTLPDGTPGVMVGGTLAGPGQTQTPEMQGAAGAMMGGFNGATLGENTATSRNPGIGLPTAGQPNRMRRRGGAIPGKPQLQGLRKPGQRP